jgi:DNA modification methylase
MMSVAAVNLQSTSGDAFGCGAIETIESIAVMRLKPYPGNARKHSKKQIRQIAESIRRFGFTNPVLISDEDEIIAGQGRVEAAKLLGMGSVPTLRLSHLDATQRRAYVIADNKLAANAGWDRELLAIELQALVELDFEVEITGFSITEIDGLINESGEPAPRGRRRDGCEDEIPSLIKAEATVTRPGDLWHLDRHRLLCGDCRDGETLDRLLEGEYADLVFTDLPHNGPRGAEALTAFLRQTLGQTADRCGDGAIALVCTDWRRMGELIAAGKAVFSELENLCVWNNTSTAMASLHGSQHELVFVFRVGNGPPVDVSELGDSHHSRSNVWSYAGVNLSRADRANVSMMRPTIKPVALVADAIRDHSKRGTIVLDPFGGLGTTLIAAEQTDRHGRLVEFDPSYCDLIVRRFENTTGKKAILATSGQAFEAVSAERGSSMQPLHCEEQVS